ncbi:glucose oxidase protein [Rutstroemia sp. NJR-2017a BBW]|nr:glucose oxidase protein [Rutstroemia sp. NJR-2017a BBW]
MSNYNIHTKVDLPGVGENLQDQPNNVLLYQGNETYNGTTPFVAYAPLSSVLPNPPQLNLTEIAITLSTALNNTLPISSLIHLLNIQQDLIIRAEIPNAEIILGNTVTVGAGPSNILSTAIWVLLPFSRGNVHIGSPDPVDYPIINPNFFIVDWDLKVQVAIAKYARRFWAAQPLGSFVAEMTPGYGVLGKNATEEEWEEWVKGSFSSNSHPVGTCAMMSRELGGVVDPKLKIYGTSNVRVVDASIWPYQISGHLTSTLYAVAERAADIIKAESGL